MTVKYDGVSRAAVRWSDMDQADRDALLGRWAAWQRGDHSQVTFQDAEILCYLADREL